LQKGLIFTGSFKTVVSRNTAVTFLLIIAGNIFAALSRVNQNLSGFDVVWQFFLYKRLIFNENICTPADQMYEFSGNTEYGLKFNYIILTMHVYQVANQKIS
jgi:hypothetical protein